MKCHNSTKITIEGRNIGPDFPPYVIAEISGNHNGNIKNAIDYVMMGSEKKSLLSDEEKKIVSFHLYSSNGFRLILRYN